MMSLGLVFGFKNWLGIGGYPINVFLSWLCGLEGIQSMVLVFFMSIVAYGYGEPYVHYANIYIVVIFYKCQMFLKPSIAIYYSLLKNANLL